MFTLQPFRRAVYSGTVIGCVLFGTVTGARGPQRLTAQRQLTPPTESGRILVFGGEKNRVYLGCFSCNEFEPESVFNQIGSFGSGISPISLANRIAEYGSKISPYSACNEIASHPPVLVDEDGTYYGELTINHRRPRRITAPAVVAWLTTFCAADD